MRLAALAKVTLAAAARPGRATADPAGAVAPAGRGGDSAWVGGVAVVPAAMGGCVLAGWCDGGSWAARAATVTVVEEGVGGGGGALGEAARGVGERLFSFGAPATARLAPGTPHATGRVALTGRRAATAVEGAEPATGQTAAATIDGDVAEIAADCDDTLVVATAAGLGVGVAAAAVAG